MELQPSSVDQIKLASGLSTLAGLWEIVAPFTLGYAALAAATTNAIMVGIIIAILAALRFLGAYRAVWLSYIIGAFGIWLILAPFVLGYSGFATPTTNDILIGMIVVVLSFWAIASTRNVSFRR